VPLVWSSLAKGVSYIWVQVPKSAKGGDVKLKLTLSDGAPMLVEATVVRQVGKH